MLAWQNGIVKEVIIQTHNTRSFIIEATEQPVFDFIPGQFVTLDLPISERPSQRMRSYSIASAPMGNNQFELLISHKEGGLGSTYLFEEAVEGASLRFRGPAGKFVLPATLDRPIVMISTGTGIAPFRSQILHLLHHQIPVPEIHLVFGTRKESDILYHNELLDLEKTYPHFHYHVALSRHESHEWKGAKGYVHDVYETISEKGKRDMDFYLCGWRNMVADAKTRIAALGYDKERVHLEVYD
ncbi:MAG TPA: FAD-binding oxidoreductase [Chitinophagales bacterium]|nr:FAD-binding oxidoreductase [Chitinophagales bacterium]